MDEKNDVKLDGQLIFNLSDTLSKIIFIAVNAKYGKEEETLLHVLTVRNIIINLLGNFIVMMTPPDNHSKDLQLNIKTTLQDIEDWFEQYKQHQKQFKKDSN